MNMAGILLLGSREGETVAVQFSPCLNEMNLIVHMRYILLPPFYRAFACNNCLGNSFTCRTRIEDLIYCKSYCSSVNRIEDV